MYVKKVQLTDFRNYQTATVELAQGVNLLYGPNGQGKTNLVEAINFFGSLSSHRVAGHAPLIRQGAASAIISVELAHQDRELLLEFEINNNSPNRARLNKSPTAKPKDILGYLNSVIFAPEDLDVIKKDPSNRRDFIDQLIVQFAPRMIGVYSDYERVLKQRNTLLKTARTTGTRGQALSTLSAWDESLVNLGSEIIAARVMISNKLRPSLALNYRDIAKSNNEPRMFIKSSILGSIILDGDESDDSEYLETPDREEIAILFREKLGRMRQKEIDRGLSLVGPHRDDLVLILGSLPAKGYASHGESWSYALSLRLASLEILRQESQLGDPILILDDVFAELDSGRRAKLAEVVKGNEQVIITAAAVEDVPKTLSAKRFSVVAGEIAHG
jgi:DNA replication and repair protein RecF